jgi:hypothetical protein
MALEQVARPYNPVGEDPTGFDSLLGWILETAIMFS